MWKNRICYIFVMLITAVLLFFFSKPFLLYLFIFLAAFAFIMAVAVEVDSKAVEIDVSVKHAVREGEQIPLRISISSNRSLVAASGVVLDIEIYNSMFEKKYLKRIVLPLKAKEENFDFMFSADMCGELKISCVKADINDMLELFSIDAKPFKSITTVVYPRKAGVNVEILQSSKGEMKEEGMVQNRKGNDPSEIFDFREYVPGDDIRAIHWKLSGKTDSLILRQASDPSHYNVVLMADFGMNLNKEAVSDRELNAAAALCMAIGEQLVRCGVSFCLASPVNEHLHLWEITGEKELHNSFIQWLSIHIQKESGMGVKYFDTEHMEERFTRLIVVSAGKYSKNMETLNGRISAVVINAVEGIKDVQAGTGNNCEIIEIPAQLSTEHSYSISC